MLLDCITHSRFGFSSTWPLQLLHVFNVSNKSNVSQRVYTPDIISCVELHDRTQTKTSHVGTRKPALVVMFSKRWGPERTSNWTPEKSAWANVFIWISGDITFDFMRLQLALFVSLTRHNYSLLFHSSVKSSLTSGLTELGHIINSPVPPVIV